jgi:Tripartite tricarboxylate transporter family receptor
MTSPHGQHDHWPYMPDASCIIDKAPVTGKALTADLITTFVLRSVVWAFPVGIMTLSAIQACGQEYPNKPIRMVVSGIAGSSNFAARLIAQGLSGALGQQVVVDGREGGVIAAEIAARAQPDGYTLHLNGSALWLLPFMRSRVPYDPVRDFAPVTLAVSTPNILVVHPSVCLGRDLRRADAGADAAGDYRTA